MSEISLKVIKADDTTAAVSCREAGTSLVYSSSYEKGDRIFVEIGETPAVGLNFPNIKEDWYRDLSRTKEHHKEVICDMIARDKNHASIVM